jgi:murein DD-endopeptidase MepM/ murein hydrolase activator NlpD
MLKNMVMLLRTWIKLILLIFLGLIIVLSIFVAFYKPIYQVTINEEIIGYSKDKSELQKRINEYMEKGDGANSNLAFIQIDNMPQYKLCLLKRGIETNDEDIYNNVISTGIAYYKYYSILDNNEEKLYVQNFKIAENIVEKLKEKKSNNIKDISILEKYGTELKEFTSEEDAVSKLYEAKPVVVATKPKVTKTSIPKSMSHQKVPINISLIRPISGIITSRFASISSVRNGAHTGLDIAAKKGTPIAATASGTVIYSGYQGTFGYLVKISHGNGIETYYAHCSALYAKVGQQVNQGDIIAAVGSTGNSTGPHLHLEVRINGVAYNPQNYVY